MTKLLPNILITGTPGTGKTSTAELVAIATQLHHINTSQIITDHQCHLDYDELLQSWELDEDKFLDVLEPLILKGGNVVDYHGCDFFPEDWFDLIVVLQTTNGNLYSRLESR